MAKVTRWSLFWRAFFVTLFFGSSANAIEQNEADAWDTAAVGDTPECYYLYLSLFPAGEYVEEAVNALTRLGASGPRGYSDSPIICAPGDDGQPPLVGIYQ